MPQNKIHKLIDGLQGSYEWGTRDCLTVAAAIIEHCLGPEKAPDYSPWHELSEPEAIAKALREYGGAGQAVMAHLQETEGVAHLAADTPIEPCDIVILGGIVEVPGGAWDTSKRGYLTGFVDESFAILHFAPYGLAPLESPAEIIAIFRCQ